MELEDTVLLEDEGSSPANDEIPHVDLLGQIAELARVASCRSTFYQEAVDALGRTFQSPCVALEARIQTEVFTAQYSSGEVSPQFWKPTVDQAIFDTLAENLPISRVYEKANSPLRIALFSGLIYDASGSSIGAVALVAPQLSRQAQGARLALFRAALSQISLCGDHVGSTAASGTSTADAVVNILGRLSAYSSKAELAFTVTNNFRSRADCDQVALGIVQRKRVRLLSISGQAEIAVRSPGVRRIQAAMEECVDIGMPIVHQSGDGWGTEESRVEFRVHRQWHEAAGGAAVASIPIFRQGQCIAVFSLRRAASRPFHADQIEEYKALVQPYIQALDLVDRANRSLREHVVVSSRAVLHAGVRAGHWQRKAGVVLGLAFCAWFVLGKVDYEIPASCAILPAEVRNFSAPFDVVLRRAPFVAGDRVRAGDVLCEFDSVQLELERQQLRARLEIVRLEESRALVSGDRIAVELARAERRHLEAQLEIVAEKIRLSTVRAPCDGVIVSGDLRDRTGDVLQQGEELFTLSSERGWNLQLGIPERDVMLVEPGREGNFSSFARPEESQRFHIVRIRPSADVRGGKNVYVAEARTDYKPEWMRSGMQGVAHVDAGRHPVWWTALRRVIHFFRLHFLI